MLKDKILYFFYNLKLNKSVFFRWKTLILVVIITFCSLLFLGTLLSKNNGITEDLEQVKKSYENIYDNMEYYQAKYWEIIKRHNVLLQLGEFDEDYYNDLAELNALFVIIENKISYNNKYLTKLHEVDKKYETNDGETQVDRSQFAGNYNDAIDSVLNELYQDIRKNIPASDFENLKQSEIKWLKDIEAYKKVMDSQGFGTISGTIYPYTIADMRKFRILLLIPYIE